LDSRKLNRRMGKKAMRRKNSEAKEIDDEE
jgi:hypothetical protein